MCVLSSAKFVKKGLAVDNLTEMTDAAIAELEQDPRVLSLRIAIEGQFDRWTQVLFPLLKLKEMGCYVYVTNMLQKAGHEKANKDLVGVYMRRIAKHRNVASVVRAKPVQAPVGVTPSVTLTRPAREVRADPVVRGLATDRPVAQAVSVPGVVPVEVTDWHAEYKRLDSESREASWTGADQWMWDFISSKATLRGLHMFQNAPDVEDMLTMTQKSCYTHLLNKYPRCHK